MRGDAHGSPEGAAAFAKETLPSSDQRGENHWRDYSERAIGTGSAYLWYDHGEPVAMAFTSRPTRNGISINAVYTPLDKRQRGYASAAVAQLSRKMLDNGKRFCVLYTDQANPTPNRVYQRIGYQEIGESKFLIFENI